MALLTAVLAVQAPEALAADACPNAAIRAAQGSERLPDCRAFELVTPADKGGMFVAINQGVAALPAKDGDRFLWTAMGPVPGSETPLSTAAVASRGPGGWTSTMVLPLPPVAHPDAITANFRPADGNDDLSAVIYGDALAVTANYDPADQNATGVLGVKDVYMWPFGGAMTLMSRGNTSTHTATGNSTYAGRSADASHLLFQTQNRLLPIDAGRVSGDAIYDRTGGSTVVVDLADDESLLSPCGASLGGASTQQHAVSADGARIFFQSPARNAGAAAPCDVPAQVYLREDADRTVRISRSRLEVPETTLPARFEGAAVDGSIVYLSSAERLVDEAPADAATKLYAYLTATDDLRYLASPLRQVTTVSPDGTRFAFTRPGGAGFELWVGDVEGGLSLAGELDGVANQREFNTKAAFSPNGRYLAFVPATNQASGAFTGDAYRFDWEANETVCVSCRPDGSGSGAPTTELAERLISSAAARVTRPDSLTDTGTVFFTTVASLVDRDRNSVRDVYVYSHEGLELVSNGSPEASGSRFIGLADDGDSAFIVTDDSLTAQDLDNGDSDIYVARVGGGFLAPSPPTSCDALADSCQADGAGQPLPTSPQTPAPGGGNASAVRPKVFSFTKLGLAQRRRAARSGVLRIRLRGSSAGRLSLAARARIGKRTRRVARKTVRVRKAGVTTVRLRLSPVARRVLRRGRALELRVTATQPGARARTINIRLRRPQS